jgi:hypothetical protein
MSFEKFTRVSLYRECAAKLLYFLSVIQIFLGTLTHLLYHCTRVINESTENLKNIAKIESIFSIIEALYYTLLSVTAFIVLFVVFALLIYMSIITYRHLFTKSRVLKIPI